MLSVNSFLRRVKIILNKNEEIRRFQQESFNIFSILRKEHDEEKLHSAFIAALLDIKGSHGLGKIFLSLFVEQLELKFEVDEFVNVRVEKHTSQGRIDIYLRNGQNQIIAIENKIYAIDQPQQLLRYHTHLQKTAPTASTLLYLTLEGKEASKISTTNKAKKKTLEVPKDYQTVSYHSDIIVWLSLCLKEAAEYPTLRESIRQYINLLKKLTGQLSHHQMEEEIYQEIKRNYGAAKLIADNIGRVREREIKAFFFDLKTKLEKELAPDWKADVTDLSKKWAGLYLYHSNWPKGNCIGLQGQPKVNSHHTVYGICASSNLWDRTDINKKLDALEIDFEGFKETKDWPKYKDIFHFGHPDELGKLFNPVERENLLEEVCIQLKYLALAGEKIFPAIAVSTPDEKPD